MCNSLPTGSRWEIWKFSWFNTQIGQNLSHSRKSAFANKVGDVQQQLAAGLDEAEDGEAWWGLLEEVPMKWIDGLSATEVDKRPSASEMDKIQ